MTLKAERVIYLPFLNCDTINCSRMSLLSLLSGAIILGLVHETPQQGQRTRHAYGRNGDVCMSKECILASASIFNNMNRDAKPCNNFFEFACGGFVKNKVMNAQHKKGPYRAQNKMVNMNWDHFLDHFFMPMVQFEQW